MLAVFVAVILVDMIFFRVAGSDPNK
jgi:hypothetical protein